MFSDPTYPPRSSSGLVPCVASLLLKIPWVKEVVVYNCFFVESRQAKWHQHDVMLHAVEKRRTWVTAGGYSNVHLRFPGPILFYSTPPLSHNIALPLTPVSLPQLPTFFFFQLHVTSCRLGVVLPDNFPQKKQLYTTEGDPRKHLKQHISTPPCYPRYM